MDDMVDKQIIILDKKISVYELKGFTEDSRKMNCGVGLCGSCCIGESNDISVCKDGPIFKSEQLKNIPQFGNDVK